MNPVSLNNTETSSHRQQLAAAKSTLLPDAIALRLADTFKILGDQTRIRILSILTKNELCVCDIAEALSMQPSAISHQLRVLRSASLVKFRKEGKEVWYSLADDHVVILMQQGLDHVLYG